MKHLIETADSSGLTRVDYNRIILDSDTDDIIVRRGGEGNPNGHPYVDLGLSVKWATMNVGATSETDYGDYFMWGSITPDTNNFCDWSTAPFNGGAPEADENSFNLVKDTACPNGILAKGYDAAAQIMGGDWRMPTQAEFEELLSNTNNAWVNNFKGTGVNGWKFTGRNGNSIFIPAADFRSGSSFYGREDYNGDIWSSSLFTSRPKNAWYLNFFSDDFYVDYADRNYGLMVRGVL